MKMSCYRRIDSQHKNTQHDYKNRGTQQNQHIILSVVYAERCAFNCYAECSAFNCYAEFSAYNCSADCRYAECHYVECRGTLLPTV